MFNNYLVTAIRNLKKGWVSTFSQSVGLAIGLAVFVLVNIIAEFEENFDTFFKNYERIYTVYVEVNPEAGLGMKSSDGIFDALQPVLELNIPEIELSARLMGAEMMVKSGDKKFYQAIVFVDPDFLDIIQLDFIQGAAGTALTGPGSVMISKSTAEKYFGSENPIGEMITVDNAHDMQVTAVFADLPSNSHFKGSITSDIGFEMVATVGARTSISDYDPIGNWNSLNSTDRTYIMLPEGADPIQFENKLVQIFDQHIDAEALDYFDGFHLRPLKNMNLFVWETSGIPALAALRILGIMILLIACLNYMTMAAARGLSRLREVGLRKALGATQVQLIGQFLVESVAIAFIALLVAILLVKLAIPAIGNITTRALSFNVFGDINTLAGLALIMLITGLFAGGYSAWVISRIEVINALHGSTGRTGKKNIMRSILLVIQYTASIVLAVAVLVTYAQNNKLQEGAFRYHRDHVVNVARMGNDNISPHYEALKAGWLAIPAVEMVTISSQVPFQQRTSITKMTPVSGDENLKQDFQIVNVGKDFAATYDMQLLSGRALADEFSEDSYRMNEAEDDYDQATINVMVNESAVTALAYESPGAAVGQLFYGIGEEATNSSFRIVGVLADINYMGFFSRLRPTVFRMPEAVGGTASIRINTEDIPGTLAQIDDVWNRVLPIYPIDRRFLDEGFTDIFFIFEGINSALAFFSLIGLSLAIVGLFGMTVYLTNSRTKEIGLRKVLGATVQGLMTMLSYQITRPVLLATIIACPLAYLTMGAYLNFFTDRVELSVFFFLKIGVVVMLIAWMIVGARAYKVANTNPADVLRYE